VTKLTQKAATAPGFLEEFAGLCRKASRYMEFLARANDLPW
jgi:hypothetical protein